MLPFSTQRFNWIAFVYQHNTPTGSYTEPKLCLQIDKDEAIRFESRKRETKAEGLSTEREILLRQKTNPFFFKLKKNWQIRSRYFWFWKSVEFFTFSFKLDSNLVGSTRCWFLVLGIFLVNFIYLKLLIIYFSLHFVCLSKFILRMCSNLRSVVF